MISEHEKQGFEPGGYEILSCLKLLDNIYEGSGKISEHIKKTAARVEETLIEALCLSHKEMEKPFRLYDMLTAAAG